MRAESMAKASGGWLELVMRLEAIEDVLGARAKALTR
jgi:hypothetical protein